MTVLPAPVVMLPDVSVSVAPTVLFTPLSEMPAALLMVRLLNVVAFAPPIVWALVPLSVTVLVPAVNVPLLEKSPFTTCEKDEVFNVVPDPSVTLPFTVSAPAAVVLAVPLMVKLPCIVRAPGMVLVPLPLRVRLPYASLDTDWLVP